VRPRRGAATRRIARARPCGPAPELDHFDVLRRGDRWVALAPIEARIVELLLGRCGTVVGRRELVAVAWPDGVPAARALDARLVRLRARVEPLGLQIHNVRRRGLMLEVGESRH
jgi:DNA-binding winged helix-turn-helix (wHTH) protein